MKGEQAAVEASWIDIANFCCWQILLQVFLGGERKILEPPMRFTAAT